MCQFFKHCLSVPYIMEFSAQKLWYQGGQSLVLSKAEQWTQVKSKLMTIILTCGRYVLCLRHGGDQCGKRSEWAPSLRPSIHGNMNDKNYKQIKCTKIVPPIYTERIILWKESLIVMDDKITNIYKNEQSSLMSNHWTQERPQLFK